MAKGHARKRKDGKWQLEVDLGSYIDPDTGKKKRNRKYRTITVKGPREANTELARFVAEVTGEGYYEPEKMNFVDFVNKEWIPKCANKRLAHTTVDIYMTHLKLRILPAFQFLRMDQIKPKHIIDFLNNLSEKGMRADKKKGSLSNATIAYNYRILSNIFNFAQELQIIKSSPMKGVKKPNADSKEVNVYTLDEAIQLLECLEKEVDMLHWQVIIKLALTTGMRRSELFGLEFKHIDLDNMSIRVRQAVTYSKNHGIQVHEIKKGRKGAKARDITLSGALVEPIKKLQLQRKKERLAKKDEDLWMNGKYDFLLCNNIGKPYNPYSMKNWWKRFVERHELKYINIHALRHTAATLLINEGIHPKIISERLGHSDIQTTMNVYGHALKQADEIATKKLDSALFSKIDTRQ